VRASEKGSSSLGSSSREISNARLRFGRQRCVIQNPIPRADFTGTRTCDSRMAAVVRRNEGVVLVEGDEGDDEETHSALTNQRTPNHHRTSFITSVIQVMQGRAESCKSHTSLLSFSLSLFITGRISAGK
jgi:hypothetical protein